MAENVTDRFLESMDAGKLDPGTLLPGYSVPVATVDGKRTHAFREFQLLRLDGLAKASRATVLRSLCDVAISLKRLHDEGIVDGRIASVRLHDRGMAGQSKATLWMDAGEQTRETVHAGDAEAMYWRPQRLQSGADPENVDDWYAFGVLMAEAVMSSESVRKIWDLSKQDGEFSESLVKNLKRAKGERWFRKAAIQLIRESAAGGLPTKTIERLASPSKAHNPIPIYVGIAASLIAIGTVLWLVERRQNKISRLEDRLAEAQASMETLEQQAKELAELRRKNEAVVATPVPIPAPSERPSEIVVSNAISDQQRWQTEMAGRSLEDVIADSASITVRKWAESLQKIHSTVGQKQWRAQDRVLRREVQRAVDQPWDQSRLDAVDRRLESLGEAHLQWQKWARSSMGISEVQTRRGLMPTGMVKDYLGQWLGEILDIDELEIDVRVDAASTGNETTAHRLGLATEADETAEDWDWGSADGTGEKIRLTLKKYRSGERVSFWLQQDSSIPYWDTTVVEHTFESPLFVWLLGKGLRLVDSESGYQLVLSTTEQVGPPVRLERSRMEEGKARLDPVEVRKVIDPLDELPFGLE